MDGCMSPPAYTPAQNNILIISRQTQGLYVSVPVRTMPIKDGVKVSKANPRLSPANRPRSMILASQYWRKPRIPWQKWQAKTAEISRYCSAFPGYGGMRGFPLTRTLRVVFTRREVAFGVVIRGVELYDLVKIEFWFSLRLLRLRSSENWVVEVESRGGRRNQSQGVATWVTLLLQIPTIWSLAESEENENHPILPTSMSSRHDYAYDSDLWFSLTLL